MIPDFKEYKYVRRPVEYFERKRKKKVDAKKLIDNLRHYKRPPLRTVPSGFKKQAGVAPVYGQSPVNIDEGQCAWQWYPPLEFYNMYNPNTSSLIQNTGHTSGQSGRKFRERIKEHKSEIEKKGEKSTFAKHINDTGHSFNETTGIKYLHICEKGQISVEGGQIRGGPLFGEYSFLQMHFHWAEGEVDGTEHAIDGYRYISEAHFVFQANQNGNFDSPAERPPLCVLGALFKVSDYEPRHNFSNYLDRIVQPKTSVVANENLLLDFGKYLRPSGYYTYSGSLTTPPYTENVQWIVYKPVFFISRYEIHSLRALKDEHGGLIDVNVRELQNIGARIITATTED